MNVEQAGAEALLEQGVSVPFKEVRIPFTKKRWQPRITMRRPRLGSQIKIQRLRLRMGVTHEQIEGFTEDQSAAFMAGHGVELSKMIALMVCPGFFSSRFCVPVVAFLIREFVDNRFIHAAYMQYVTLLSARSFSTIIRSAEVLNPMAPTLSQTQKGS